MACAKPLLVVSGKDTPIFNFLNPVSCSYLITESNVDKQSEKLIEVIQLNLMDKTELVNMGSRGYKHIENTYSKDVVTMQYVNLSNKLMSES
jgi:colanic acid biosynthesis glycosyl transferase WcaI